MAAKELAANNAAASRETGIYLLLTRKFNSLLTGYDVQMSCLTRKLQQKLTRYVQKNSSRFSSNDPQCIREELVNKGVCPSDVTTDQLNIILKEVKNS